MERTRLSDEELLEFAVEELCDLHGQYTTPEVLDQYNQYYIRVGDLRSLERCFRGARKNFLEYEAAFLTISYLLRTETPVPDFVLQWVHDYRNGKIKRPKRDRAHNRAFPGQDVERNRGIYQIVCALERMGVPRRPSVHDPAYSCYEVVAKAQRELGERPNSANGIRKICEVIDREVKEGKTSFSQIDLLIALKGAR